MDSLEQEKLKRAKKRVDEIKGFYIHFSIYLIINTFILINLSQHTDNFWQLQHFFTPFLWGLGLGFHAIKTFNWNLLFSKSWEERQIKKYMDKDRDEADRFL